MQKLFSVLKVRLLMSQIARAFRMLFVELELLSLLRTINAKILPVEQIQILMVINGDYKFFFVIYEQLLLLYMRERCKFDPVCYRHS